MPALATHLLFTSSGRISVVIHVKDKELFRKLADLQRNLGVIPDVPRGFGGISHARCVFTATVKRLLTLQDSVPRKTREGAAMPMKHRLDS